MNSSLLAALIRSGSTVLVQSTGTDNQEIPCDTLRTCLSEILADKPVNAVLLNSTCLSMERSEAGSTLRLLLESIDTEVSKLGKQWRKTYTNADAIDDAIRTCGLQLDSFYTKLDTMAGVLPSYSRTEVRKLLRQRCCKLVKHVAGMVAQLSRIESDEDVWMTTLTLIVMVLHQLMRLRVQIFEPEYAAFACTDLEDLTTLESSAVESIAQLPDIASRYGSWVHRLLVEVRAEEVMTAVELMPYMDPVNYRDIHHKLLTERIVNHVEHSTSLEGAILRRMQENGLDGNSHWKLSQLLGDLDSSRQYVHMYENQHVRQNADAPVVHPLIVRNGLWNLGTATSNPTLPPLVANELKQFEEYMGTRAGYSVQPIPHQSWAVIEFDGDEEKVYNIKVSLPQLAVLECFNEGIMITGAQLSDRTSMAGEWFPATLRSLLVNKLLRRRAHRAGEKDLHPKDMYILNPNFSHTDIDISIKDDDHGMAEVRSWTRTELRKALRAELRSEDNQTLLTTELHMRAKKRFGAVDYASVLKAVQRMIDAELVTYTKGDKPVEKKPEDLASKITGKYVPMEIRQWLGDDHPTQVYTMFYTAAMAIKNKLRNDLAYILGGVPTNKDLPAVLSKYLTFPANVSNPLRPTIHQLTLAIRKMCSDGAPKIKRGKKKESDKGPRAVQLL